MILYYPRQADIIRKLEVTQFFLKLLDPCLRPIWAYKHICGHGVRIRCDRVSPCLAEVQNPNFQWCSRARKCHLDALEEHHIRLLHFRICYSFSMYFCDRVPEIRFVQAVIASFFLVLFKAPVSLLGWCYA